MAISPPSWPFRPSELPWDHYKAPREDSTPSRWASAVTWGAVTGESGGVGCGLSVVCGLCLVICGLWFCGLGFVVS